MLKIRILTAVVLAPAGIAMILLTPEWVFRLVIIAFMLVGTWEFRRLAGLAMAAGVTLLVLQTSVMALMFLYWPMMTGHAFTLLVAGCFAWCLMFLRLARYRAEQAPDRSFQVAGFASALAGITICTFSLALLRDQAQGEFLVLLLLITVWAADIGAYFGGQHFGRTKLAPVISPKKTREGVIGGIVLASIAALLLQHFTPGLEIPAGPVVLLVAITVLTSVGGDLFISIHKRTVKLKDCGNIFPGHGGVLDRFDSLLAAAPFYTLAVWMLGS